MRFRKTLSFFILARALTVAPLAGARQKNVGPSSAGPRPNAVRPYVACAALMGGGAVAAVSDRRTAVGTRQKAERRSTLQSVALKDGATAATSGKPFTQEQVSNMVRNGFGDESGAKLIEQRGIDFAPSEDFVQTLKAAGASEAFLNALRSAKPPEPASAKKPLNQVQVFALLAGQVPSHRVTMLVQERGIDFEPTDDYLQEVRLAGGEDELVSALKGAKVTKSVTIDPGAQARQTELRQHMARGADFERKGQYVQAEQEYRAALLEDPQNNEFYASLAYALVQEQKWDDAASAAREAMRLNPNNDAAHFNLGVALGHKGETDGEIAEEHAALQLNPDNDGAHFALGWALAQKGDREGAIPEFREALRLNPNNDMAHIGLGAALGGKGDSDGAIAEYHEALHLNPNNSLAHLGLGLALGQRHDLDGEITEERKAIRLNPNIEVAHVNLGLALGAKGDWDGEIAEEREALRLNPNNDVAHNALALALGGKGDWHGAIPEFREALRLNPKNEQAHANLGLALGNTHNWDGEIAEEREALRLNPNNAFAHNGLGFALQKKGDLRGALEEYLAATTLNPQDKTYKENYERLLHRVKE